MSLSRFLFLFAFVCSSQLFAQSIVINEVCPSNSTVLLDADGDSSDWIELFNPSANPVQLAGYGISTKQNDADPWHLPPVEIAAQSYLILFTSDKNMVNQGELHTDFKLAQAGEAIFLYNAKGEVVDEVAAAHVPQDFSLARVGESQSMLRTPIPTPGAANEFPHGVLSSAFSGFYPAPVELHLESLNDAHSIHYTLNGNTPTAEDVLYSQPIVLSPRSENALLYSHIPTTPLEGPYQLDPYKWKSPEAVNLATTLRYASFDSNGNRQSEVYTQTFFIGEENYAHYSLPIVHIAVDSLSLFGHESGIYVPGARFEEEGFEWWPQGNYHNDGAEWEREAHLSYFAGQEKKFETNVGLRMRGNSSVCFPQKSFNIYFREEYGMKRLNFNPFPQGPDSEHKRLILRNSGNDFLHTHFRDALLHDALRNLDLDIMESEPAVCFINGEYWGIFNIREKLDERYLEHKLGADEDVNVLSVCGIVREGSNEDYLDLANFVKNNDMSVTANYQVVEQWLDISNFIDYHIAEIYFASYDWPCNNYLLWKDNNPNSKWRHMLYDLDFAAGLEDNCSYEVNSMEHATVAEGPWPHCGCSNLLFRGLLENEAFEERFITTMLHRMSTHFCSDQMVAAVDAMAERYAPEMEEHISRWGYPTTMEIWQERVERMKEYMELRPQVMKTHLSSYFQKPLPRLDCVPLDAPPEAALINLYPNPSSGFVSLTNISGKKLTGANVYVLNSFGQRIVDYNLVDLEPFFELHIELGHLAAGSYLVVLETVESKEVVRLALY